MLSSKEKFIAILSNDSLKKANAIIILEGDGLNRVNKGARLYKEGWAPRVVISGGINQPPHSLPSSQMLPYLLEMGVPKEDILLEDKSMNTREQAIEIMKLVNDKKWETIILVASHYHQYRAYLTFLKAMNEAGLKILMINSPERSLKWFEEDISAGGKRADVLESEFEKIQKYGALGHIASFEEAIEYQQFKENYKK